MKEEDTDRLHLLAMRVNCTRQHISFGSVKIGLIFTTKDPASLLGWKDLPRTCYFRFRVKEPARIFLFLSLLHALRYFFPSALGTSFSFGSPITH